MWLVVAETPRFPLVGSLSRQSTVTYRGVFVALKLDLSNTRLVHIAISDNCIIVNISTCAIATMTHVSFIIDTASSSSHKLTGSQHTD